MNIRSIFFVFTFIFHSCLTVTEKELPPKIEIGLYPARLQETLVVVEEYRNNIDPEKINQEDVYSEGEDQLLQFRDPVIGGRIKRSIATAFADCRCFQNVAVAFKGVDDIDLIKRRYKNIVYVKFAGFFNSQTAFNKILLGTFTLGLVPTWYFGARKAEFSVETNGIRQPSNLKYDRRFTLYSHLFLAYGLFNSKNVFGGYTGFYDLIQLASTEIYSKKFIPLDN
ncbi:hypothetical protein [Leptospira stimsonii]|uniref:Uncharacterized protein n=1 Tax=Leptospira stimsonii TaxID=2202203 RepID=A0A396Z0H0_9LEPT|nr:hypothetical protein [Leptospira stimsonii]RHX87168.1 hypothetical protein DLM75_16780 [Leptospira stimsonii]